MKHSSFDCTFDAVIIGNGTFPETDEVRRYISDSKLVVCCDGGSTALIDAGYTPDWIVGDGDSISPKNKELYKAIFIQIPEQDTNDQTKATNFCVNLLAEQGLSRRPRILILGATGKREDHTLGNISLIANYFDQADVISMSDYGYFRAAKDIGHWKVCLGQQLSIFNINATGFKCEGLKYPLYDFKEWWQGTLNEAINNRVTIYAKGKFLVYVSW